jgi:hypothetical protein
MSRRSRTTVGERSPAAHSDRTLCAHVIPPPVPAPTEEARGASTGSSPLATADAEEGVEALSRPLGCTARIGGVRAEKECRERWDMAFTLAEAPIAHLRSDDPERVV